MNNHLSAGEKRKSENWILICLVEIPTYATPQEGRAAPNKRHRATYSFEILHLILRSQRGLGGRVGVTCVDLNGDDQCLVPSLQGARLDGVEVQASSKCKHCPVCEAACKEHLGQHPPTRELRDAHATEQLVCRAIAAMEARREALANTAPGSAERRRTKRRLRRLRLSLKKRGTHGLPNGLFGLRRTNAFLAYTWSELHVIWQGTIKNLITLTLAKVLPDDALLAQIDAALLRWARPMATMRGRGKARGLSGLLAREGPEKGQGLSRWPTGCF